MDISRRIFQSYWAKQLLEAHPLSDNMANIPVGALEASVSGEWSDRLLSRDARLTADSRIGRLYLILTMVEVAMYLRVLVEMQVPNHIFDLN